jgi:L-lactate utilization protein LutC
MSEAESSAPQNLSVGTFPVSLPSTVERFEQLPDALKIEEVARNLEANGFQVIVVSNKDEARKAVEQILPEGTEVFDSTSVTLEETGIARMILDSGRYHPVRPELIKLASDGKKAEQRRMASSPAYIVGSVHAVTEKGQVVVASASGSQLGPYAFGAEHVVWVVGAQKIVRDLDEAYDRIYSYTLPRESARARKAYGVPGSVVAKILVVNREVQPGRVTILLVKERLGF